MNAFDIKVSIVFNLPRSIYGFVYRSNRKGYLLLLNWNINYETQCRVFLHEIKHIINDMPTIGYVIGLDMQYKKFECEIYTFQIIKEVIKLPTLSENLTLDRCPHCSIANPLLNKVTALYTTDCNEKNKRLWYIYKCHSCGGVVTACSAAPGALTISIYPSTITVDDSIPQPANTYLQQSIESIHAPSGAIMLAASSVDAMLKIKGYTEGSLYNRIDKAVVDHLITPEMAKWAHDVRLDANDQRHADQNAQLPDKEAAKRCIDFILALGDFLFVLPARVQRGLSNK